MNESSSLEILFLLEVINYWSPNVKTLLTIL